MAELAANARAGQEAAEAQLHDVLQRLAALEAASRRPGDSRKVPT